MPKVEGALVALDPHTGRVLAMSGGWDYHLSEFNRATQAMRQPGSAFKPIVYLCALEAGYTPSSIVRDAPITVSQGPGEPPWRPMNYSNRFYGPTTLRVGLEQSRNVMTVRLASEIGMDKVADCAKRLGVFDNMPHYLSYALGAGETTVLRLTTAYAMMVNGGRRIEPTVDRPGAGSLRPHHFSPGSARVPRLPGRRLGRAADAGADRSPRSRDRPEQRLSGRVDAAGRHRSRHRRARARSKAGRWAARPAPARTPRTSGSSGFSPDLVVGVFIGYDEPASLGDHAAGGTVAAPIFAAFMREALKDKPAVPFRTPPGVRLDAGGRRDRPARRLQQSAGHSGGLQTRNRPREAGRPARPRARGGSGSASSPGYRHRRALLTDAVLAPADGVEARLPRSPRRRRPSCWR